MCHMRRLRRTPDGRSAAHVVVGSDGDDGCLWSVRPSDRLDWPESKSIAANSSGCRVTSPQSAVLEKFHFLPNDDPYRHKTKHICYRASSRVCMPICTTVRRTVSEEIAHRQKRLSYFIV